MEMRSEIAKQPPVSTVVQALWLRKFFPAGKTSLGRNSVFWRGEVSPSDYARTYLIEMSYKPGFPPEVRVLDPNLKKLAGDSHLPHMYDSDTQLLCLYLPGCGFWDERKTLAKTILPWACLWLYYFELWLVTHTWHGRGEHPQVRKRRH
jgi:hypothetical protein